MTRQPKPKRCKVCKAEFVPVRPMQKACSVDCAKAMAVSERGKREAKEAAKDRAETRKRKEALRSNGERKAAAQKSLNRWIVHVRDKAQPCISCGRFHQGVYHAGHYRSRGSAPHLALDPANLAKQCAPCNLYLHGNLIGFRAGLIERYGISHVESLEADNSPRHHSGSDYDQIAAQYRALNRQAGKDQS